MEIFIVNDLNATIKESLFNNHNTSNSKSYPTYELLAQIPLIQQT